MDLKLFDLLAAASDPMTVEQLQRKTGAAPVLLGRSRFLCPSLESDGHTIPRTATEVPCFHWDNHREQDRRIFLDEHYEGACDPGASGRCKLDVSPF